MLAMVARFSQRDAGATVNKTIVFRLVSEPRCEICERNERDFLTFQQLDLFLGLSDTAI